MNVGKTIDCKTAVLFVSKRDTLPKNAHNGEQVITVGTQRTIKACLVLSSIRDGSNPVVLM